MQGDLDGLTIYLLASPDSLLFSSNESLTDMADIRFTHKVSGVESSLPGNIIIF